MSSYNKLLDIASSSSSLDTKVTACNTGAVVVASGSIAATQSGTWNVADISGTVSLPTGAATSAKQDASKAVLDSVDGKIVACNTGAVVIQSGSVAATQSGTWNIADISGTVSLPTGAATESTLQSIDGKLTGLSPALASGTLLNKTTTAGNSETSSAVDAENYSKISIWGFESTSGSSSSLTVEVSHDNSTWVPVQAVTGTFFTGTGVCFYMNFHTEARYIRSVFDPTVSVATQLFYSMK